MKKKTFWIRHTRLFHKDQYECASCGYMTYKPYKKCPYCGRSMKGSKYDASWVDDMEIINSIFGD